MVDMKVSEQVLNEIKARQTALGSANVLMKMAQQNQEMFLKKVIAELGLDPEVPYSISAEGVVNEVKPVPVQIKESEGKDDSQES